MLQIEHLSKTYANGVEALKDVSLTIPTGMFGLLGPNGAGKSTLMRTLATLQEPDTGRIELNGTDARANPDALRRRLGYLPQEFGVYPRVSPQAMLNHLAVLKGIGDRARTREAGRTIAGADEPVGRAKEESRYVLRRHAATLRNCAGADRRAGADHRRRTDGRSRSGGAAAFPQSADAHRRRRGGDSVDAHRRRRQRPVHADGDHGQRQHSGRRRTRRADRQTRGTLWKQLCRVRRRARCCASVADRVDAAGRRPRRDSRRRSASVPTASTRRSRRSKTCTSRRCSSTASTWRWSSGVFNEIFRFECRHQLGSPLFIATALTFFAFAFLGMASEQVNIGDASDQSEPERAVYDRFDTHFVLSIVAMFAAVAFVALPLTRDIELKTQETFAATGVGRLPFLFGRIGGGFLFALLAGCATVLGTLVATYMPWLDQQRIAPFEPHPYWFSVWAVMLPNMFIVGSLVAVVAALTRSLLASYTVLVGDHHRRHRGGREHRSGDDRARCRWPIRSGASRSKTSRATGPCSTATRWFPK